MAVYNTEKYLHEAINSLLNQTVGFKKNIQLILVNDGSPDRSGEICDEYAVKYPDNIKVIHKKNGGVSSARNEGLKYVTGRYVNFMDSDDKMSKNAFKSVYKFFSKNDEEIDIVSIPIMNFEAKKGEAKFNEKFLKGTRIIDLNEEYNTIQLSLSAAFIKLSMAKEMNFDTDLEFAEDAKEITRLLINKQKLGVVCKSYYYYRKRKGENISACQGIFYKKSYYSIFIKNFSLFIYNNCKEKLGFIPLFIQHTVILYILSMIKKPYFPENLLTDTEKNEFYFLLKQVLEQTDDKIILEQKHTRPQDYIYLIYLLYFKYDNIAYITSVLNNIFNIENYPVNIDFINLNNNIVSIEGHIQLLGNIKINEILILVNNKELKTNIFDRNNDIFSLDRLMSRALGFSCDIPFEVIGKTNKIQICYKINTITIKCENLIFGQFSPIRNGLKHSYYFKNGYKFYTNKNTIFFEKIAVLNHISSETCFLSEIFFSIFIKKRGGGGGIILKKG